MNGHLRFDLFQPIHNLIQRHVVVCRVVKNTEFFRVSFQGYEFGISDKARFGLDEERRVTYLELLFGGESVRVARLGPESFVPEVATPEPTATATQTPTAPPLPTPTATAKPTAAPAETDKGAGFPWAWLVALLVVVGAAVGWVAMRKGR